MLQSALRPGAATHEVTNQPPPLVGYNAYASDPALREAVRRYGAGWVEPRAVRLGALAGDAAAQSLAHDANRHAPELRTHDRWGNRIDFVEYHPAYHELMRLAFGAGVHSLAWTAREPGGHAARAVLSHLWNQIENGVGCPTAMAYAALPPLRLDPAIDAAWAPKVLAEAYDPRPAPVAQKAAATIGMALTEKQGGSDLRANATRAEPAGADGAYALTGHKWFCSAPMSDGFVTLAQTEDGPTAFFLPRSLPDGTRNAFLIQRLKEKCGNRSNASSEVEFRGTLAWPLGEPGRGIRTVIGMAHLTRIDIGVSCAGIMRRALMEALHHVRHRRAFQRHLIDQPLMRLVLADLAVESEAATQLALRIAHAADRAKADPAERLIERLATPIAKYWLCKRVTGFVVEALECHGGNGYVEEGPMARLYREAPLNGIWEGSGNVVALDVLRVLAREPEAKAAFLDELRRARGGDRRLDAAADRIAAELADAAGLERRCRRVVELMALAFQASLLVRHAPPAVADAFCAGRLGEDRGGAYGTLPPETGAAAILERAAPAAAVYG